LACQSKSRKLPYYNTSDFTPVWEVADMDQFHKIRPFSLIDQEGMPFTEKDLQNKISVVDFFFTACPGICPRMTNSMALIQQEFLNVEDVLLVSHSVTPDYDSVSVLATYAELNGIQYQKWKLLTGVKGEIYDLGRRSYFVEEDLGEERDSTIFLHTENFILIDKNRIIRGIYNGLDNQSMDALIEDIKLLGGEK
ncbi:MAG: SCO family protein, partial [Saprospiraceae bacterium]